jgi:hypothetical protein
MNRLYLQPPPMKSSLHFTRRPVGLVGQAISCASGSTGSQLCVQRFKNSESSVVVSHEEHVCLVHREFKHFIIRRHCGTTIPLSPFLQVF